MAREGTDKYDDKAKGGYSYSEKLSLVAQDLMAPQEIGMSSREEAVKEITGEENPGPKLGDFMTFECSIVPIELRAHWARQDMKIVPEGFNAKEWEQNWIAEHKDEFAVQGSVHSGTCHATMQQIYADRFLGFVEMMRKAADMLEAKYKELLQNDPNPIITRTDTGSAAKTGAAVTTPPSE